MIVLFQKRSSRVLGVYCEIFALKLYDVWDENNPIFGSRGAE